MQQRVRTITLPAQRGEIVDRSGVPLAVTREARDVYVDPTYVADPAGEAEAIAGVLDLRPRDVRAALEADGTFAWIDRQVDLEVAEDLEASRLAGHRLPRGPEALLPGGRPRPAGARVRERRRRGRCRPRERLRRRAGGHAGGAHRRALRRRAADLQRARHGRRIRCRAPTMVTTIDRQMQFMVQAALERAVQANGALGGTAVVMDPATGEVLAMATYPGFDPNDVQPTRRIEAMRNRAVTDAFEPGSVNKIITAAAALEIRGRRPGRAVPRAGLDEVGPFTIHDSHVHPVESMTIGDIITESSNIGAALIAEQVGSETLAPSWTGSATAGRPAWGSRARRRACCCPATEWDEVIRATVSYGQGISVTPLQMANVYATIANGGLWDAADARAWLRPAPTARSVRRRREAEPQDDPAGHGRAADEHAGVRRGGGDRRERADPRLPGRGQDRHVAQARRPRPLRAAVHGVVRRVPAGRRPSRGRSRSRSTSRAPSTAASPRRPLFQEIARYAIQRLAIPAAPPVALPPHAQGPS